MERIQQVLHWTVIVSAGSHIFCCVLPTLVTVLSLIAGLGFFRAFYL